MMKNILATIFLVLISVSCVTTKQALIPEDRLIQTRKYVGIFLDYRHTEYLLIQEIAGLQKVNDYLSEEFTIHQAG
jgi:hypothetical protein